MVTGKPSPTGFDVLTVDAHTWAVFTADGSEIESVQYLWRDIYTEWFPANPFRSVPGPEIMRTEYNDDFTVARFELWIPVESELSDVGALKQPPGRMEVTTRRLSHQMKQTLKESVSLR